MSFDYQQYLASREWALIKRHVRQRSRGHCERCRYGEYKQTHHLTYERIGHEDLADVQALCKECHDYLSGISDRDPASEFTPAPAVRFVAQEHRGERDWVSFAERVDLPGQRVEVPVVGDDADGLFAVFSALMSPEKIWHPFVLSGHILDAFNCPDHEDDEGRPPYIRHLSTCFFPCSEDDDCVPCFFERQGKR